MDLIQIVLHGQNCSSVVGRKARDGLLGINSSHPPKPSYSRSQHQRLLSLSFATMQLSLVGPFVV